MTWKELRFLVLMWIVLAVLAVAAIIFAPELAPTMGRFVAPLALLPTLFVYFCVFAPIYLLLRLLLWPFPPGRWRQWVADAVALAATVIVAFAIPWHFNPIVRAKAAALQAAEMPAPVKLVPVRSVALFTLSAGPAKEDALSEYIASKFRACDDFCTALLVSGYAKEVIVGFEHDRTGQIASKMTGLRFVLDGKRPDCVQTDKEWPTWFAGKALSQARAIGDFNAAFAARYAHCIAAHDSAQVVSADVILLDYFPDAEAGPFFGGIDWDPELVEVAGAQTLFENRNGTMITRLHHASFTAATLDDLVHVRFLVDQMRTPPPGQIVGYLIMGHPIDWSRTVVARGSPFSDGRWGMITNGEDIYAAALARDQVAANPPPRALSRRRKMK
jgi:hypothetical protein